MGEEFIATHPEWHCRERSSPQCVKQGYRRRAEMPESEKSGGGAPSADAAVMNASPVCRLFVVLSWYADEAEMDDPPAGLAAYLGEVAERFDREENTGCGQECEGDCECEECEGYGAVAWTYARPAADFFMWDALGSWPHRDEFLEELYRLEGEALGFKAKAAGTPSG